jgi:hypothetical protein
MKPGDTFQTTPVDRVAVASGSGAVHVNDAKLLASHEDADGRITVFLDIFTAEGAWTTYRLERIQDQAGVWLDPEKETGSNLTAQVIVQLDDAVPQFAASIDMAEPAAVLLHHNGTFSCSAFTNLTPVTVPETVAASAVTNGIRAKFTYTSTAETYASLGVSFNAGATWSGNGSATRTSTLTAGFNTITGATGSWSAKEWRANWEHKRYYRHCPGSPTGTWHEQRYTDPQAVAGFPAIINSRYGLPPCHTKQTLSGVAWIATQTATATTYGSAFSITWGPGTFSGSARSGYTASVKMRFERPEASGYWYWCGDTSNPVNSGWLRAGR